MSTPSLPTPPCHNCRRRRWKCDRSFPQCFKCIKRSEVCLGYQSLLRWEQGVASRGKMAGITFDDVARVRTSCKGSDSRGERPALPSSQALLYHKSEVFLPVSLTEPLAQNLPLSARKYVSHFTSHVCKDLVLYDSPPHNSFRELIPMSSQHPILLQVIVAISALHMSKVRQRSAIIAQCHRTSLLDPGFTDSFGIHGLESYNDALVAKQRAFYLLRSALTNISLTDLDVTLAVVLLLIEFELVDTGQDEWRHHINGARAIIERMCGPDMLKQMRMSSLRHCLVANCLVFDIFGSTLACSISLVPGDTFSTETLSLLEAAEGNHCSSFPAVLLQLIRDGARLAQSEIDASSLPFSYDAKQRQASLLLYKAQCFDPLAWATDLQSRSPTADLPVRTHIAYAHRAAVCIYLSRVLRYLRPVSQFPQDLDCLVADIVNHLSCICPDDALFKATTWPAFIAGAEANDQERQQWVTRRFSELWEIEPWGLIRGTLGILERIWAGRRNRDVVDLKSTTNKKERKEDIVWMEELKGFGIDWLIL